MIGIELCQEAVEDAKVNAKLNGKRAENMKMLHSSKEVDSACLGVRRPDQH